MIPTLVVNENHITEILGRVAPNVREKLVAALTPIATEMTADARTRAEAHIHFLGVKPGQYLASIKGGVAVKDKNITGYVRSSDPLAHLMEYGAKLPARWIIATGARPLAFLFEGVQVFARKVLFPGATMPPYPAINPAFEAARGDIMDALEGVARSAAI